MILPFHAQRLWLRRNMRTSPRFLGILLLGVLALAVAGWLWLVEGGGIPPGSKRTSSVPATPEHDPGVEVVSIEESSRWIEKLSSGEEIRIRVGETETRASQTLPSAAGIDASGRAYIEECLRARVDVLRKEFEEHYATTGWTSEEWRRLEEMRVTAALDRYKAYDRALLNGEYFVLPLTEPTPDLGPTVTCLNMGATSSGNPVKLIIVADKKKYQLDVAERELEARRRDWLARLVAEFNALPYDQREAAIGRWKANRPEDAAWRAAKFPSGLRVNEGAKEISL